MSSWRSGWWACTLLWKYKPRYGVVIYGTSAFLSIKPLFNYYFFGLVMNFFYQALGDTSVNISHIGQLLFFYGGYTAVFALIDYWSGRWQSTIKAELTAYSKTTFLEQLRSIDPQAFNNEELSLQTSALEGLQALVVVYLTLVAVIAKATTLVVVGIYLSLYIPWLVPVMVVLTLPSIWIDQHMRRLSHTIQTKAKQEVRLENSLTAALASIPKLRQLQKALLDAELVERNTTTTKRLQDELAAIRNKWVGIQKTTSVMTSLVVMIGFVTVISRFFKQRGLVGSVYFQLVTLTYFQSHIQSLAGLWQQFLIQSHTVQPIRRIFELPLREDTGAWRARFPAGPRVSLSQVTMTVDGKAVVRDLSLEIPPGQKAVLVYDKAPTGKILTDGLSRDLDVEKGIYTVNGGNVQLMSQERWNKNVQLIGSSLAYLPQLSIKENVTMGSDNRVEGRELVALERAGAWKEIEQLPHQVNQVFDVRFEGGVIPSPVLVYRILFARQLLRETPLLIISLPPNLPSLLLQDLLSRSKRYLSSTTVIMVTPSFAPTAGADLVGLIKEGELIEWGSKEALWKKQGIWARWWKKVKLAQQQNREKTGVSLTA